MTAIDRCYLTISVMHVRNRKSGLIPSARSASVEEDYVRHVCGSHYGSDRAGGMVSDVATFAADGRSAERGAQE